MSIVEEWVETCKQMNRLNSEITKLAHQYGELNEKALVLSQSMTDEELEERWNLWQKYCDEVERSKK